MKDNYEEAIEKMDFEFFANANHKIPPDSFLEKENAVFLDLRAQEEVNAVSFNLKDHCEVLHIPLHELPTRIDEIPKEKFIGLFCSGTQRASIAFGYLRGKGYMNTKIILATIDQMAAEIKPGKIKKTIKIHSKVN